MAKDKSTEGDGSSKGHISQVADLLHGLASFAWPLLAVIIALMLINPVRQAISSRDLSVRIGEYEVSIQEVADQQGDLIESIRKDVESLNSRVDSIEGKDSTTASPSESPPEIESVLWVDDYPPNNALLVLRLTEADISVTTARSTNEALDKLGKRSYSYIITDIGRVEPGETIKNTEAGLEFIREVRKFDSVTPILVFSSRVGLVGAEAKELGANIATSSSTELLRELGLGAASR